MDVAGVYHRVSAWLVEYLEPLAMMTDRGPLRALRELTFGLVFTHSPNLSNASRMRTRNASELFWAVQRMSRHLADRHWDHRKWAAAVLAQLAAAVEPDDLLSLDTTE